ncbi:hypothetical protein [Synechococcus sp. MEDNS5]|uniref:hypothetical protein n=1 Tax=Synechococcus sp. MEDNS5 TaxID=1442554 RepID=UPI0016446CA9|nr:hypothetical protein [Synechococcus sp. MEDNS5]
MVITQSNPSILPIFVALSKFCNQFKWLFIVQDLYPDVIFAYLPKFYLTYIAFPFRTIYKFFFSSCTHFVVLGESMKYRLNNYNVPDNKISIISNWALGLDKSLENIKEPILSSSDLSKSCNFIYTGNVGSAHDSAFISKVIRYSHHLPVFFEFAASGSALNQLKHNLANIHHPRNFEFTNFIPSSNYNEYLARFHFGIVSMSKSFSGIVYPSKFFGYLSRGLPILYLGSDEELCTLIRQYNIGLVLNEINIHLFPEILAALTEESLATMRANCRELYQSKFSKHQSLSSYLRLVARISNAR